MTAGFPKLFARVEPDRVYGYYGYTQIAIYSPGKILPVAVYPFASVTRPRRGDKRVMHNCCRYELEWLPDLIGPPVHVGELRARAMGWGPGRILNRAALGLT